MMKMPIQLIVVNDIKHIRPIAELKWKIQAFFKTNQQQG
jgi:hypothetical protein